MYNAQTYCVIVSTYAQITNMHNDIYIWSLWYVCLFVHCIHCTKCTKCVQFAFNLHVHIYIVCTSTSVGVKGFEPLHLGTKNRRLSTWLYSIQYVCAFGAMHKHNHCRLYTQSHDIIVHHMALSGVYTIFLVCRILT